MSMTTQPRPSVLLSPGAAGAGILFASAAFGLVPLFARGLIEEGMATYSVAFYRYLIAAIVLMPTLVAQRHRMRAIVWGVVSGMVMGLGWIGYVRAVATTPVSVVGVLYMTYPVFTVLLAWGLFGDRPSVRALLASGVIILAALLASSPASVAPHHLPALLLSLTAPIGFGFGIVVLVHRLTVLSPLARLASVSLGAVLGLAPLLLTAPVDAVLPPSPRAWAIVAAIGIATALIPQLLYSVCSPRVGAARTAILGSIELPTMFLVGLLAFGEQIGFWQGVACLLVVGAISLSGSRAARELPRPPAAPWPAIRTGGTGNRPAPRLPGCGTGDGRPPEPG